MCQLHPSQGEVEICLACEAGSPPDLGVQVVEKTETIERIS